MRLIYLVCLMGMAIGGRCVAQALTLETGADVDPTPPNDQLVLIDDVTPVKSTPPKQTLSSLLESLTKPAGPDADSFYAAVPPTIDAAVRYLAMDNFSSASAALLREYSGQPIGKEKARMAMWLGLTYGIQAITYPATDSEISTSSTHYLNEALELDPVVINAPDVARVLAEMVAHGWAGSDPAAALLQAEKKAEETRKPMDFYFAGVISRRLARFAWEHSDTTELDRKTLSFFAKSVARDPGNYETWSAYLPALLPPGLHDLATTEAKQMSEHFLNLRTPLLADQGPVVLNMSVSSYRTVEQDAALLKAAADKWPHAPMPPFETAMRAIETTVPLAMTLLSELILRFESEDIKPLPREAGYYPSALYKYAFLLSTVDQTTESLKYYHKVREVSPGYAEVNMNIAVLLAQQSDKTTTGPEKLALLEESLNYAERQEKLDYRGKGALKAKQISERLRSMILRIKQELSTE